MPRASSFVTYFQRLSKLLVKAASGDDVEEVIDKAITYVGLHVHGCDRAKAQKILFNEEPIRYRPIIHAFLREVFAHPLLPMEWVGRNAAECIVHAEKLSHNPTIPFAWIDGDVSLQRTALYLYFGHGISDPIYGAFGTPKRRLELDRALMSPGVPPLLTAERAVVVMHVLHTYVPGIAELNLPPYPVDAKGHPIKSAMGLWRTEVIDRLLVEGKSITGPSIMYNLSDVIGYEHWPLTVGRVLSDLLIPGWRERAHNQANVIAMMPQWIPRYLEIVRDIAQRLNTPMPRHLLSAAFDD